MSLVAFVCIFGGTLLVIFASARISKRRLSEDSKNAIKQGVGVIATLAALVLGLLLASAKTSYDTQSGRITQLTANLILLDRLLGQYGPEAKPAREAVRAQVPILVERIWRENSSGLSKLSPFEADPRSETIFQYIQNLAPQNDSQRSLQSRAVRLLTDIGQTRLLLYSEGGETIPLPFLAVLIFWLAIVFASFSLFTHPNGIVIAVLCLCTVSVSASIFLILALDQPFRGLMAIPREPLLNALAPLM
jgi:hypothetical protein